MWNWNYLCCAAPCIRVDVGWDRGTEGCCSIAMYHTEKEKFQRSQEIVNFLNGCSFPLKLWLEIKFSFDHTFLTPPRSSLMQERPFQQTLPVDWWSPWESKREMKIIGAGYLSLQSSSGINESFCELPRRLDSSPVKATTPQKDTCQSWAWPQEISRGSYRGGPWSYFV